jgi:hypothetical protein
MNPPTLEILLPTETKTRSDKRVMADPLSSNLKYASKKRTAKTRMREKLNENEYGLSKRNNGIGSEQASDKIATDDAGANLFEDMCLVNAKTTHIIEKYVIIGAAIPEIAKG